MTWKKIFAKISRFFFAVPVAAETWLSVPLLPVGLSILASFQSSMMIVGVSSEIYLRGTAFCWFTIGTALAAFTSAYVFVPVFYHHKFENVFEVKMHSIFRYSSNFFV